MPPVGSNLPALDRSLLAPGSGWKRILGCFVITLLSSVGSRFAGSYSPRLIVARLPLAAVGAGACVLSLVLSGVLPDAFSVLFR